MQLRSRTPNPTPEKEVIHEKDLHLAELISRLGLELSCPIWYKKNIDKKIGISLVMDFGFFFFRGGKTSNPFENWNHCNNVSMNIFFLFD